MSEISPENTSDLPKHFDPKEAEQRLYNAWEVAGWFQDRKGTGLNSNK